MMTAKYNTYSTHNSPVDGAYRYRDWDLYICVLIPRSQYSSHFRNCLSDATAQRKRIPAKPYPVAVDGRLWEWVCTGMTPAGNLA